MAKGRLLAGIAVFFWGAAYVWGKITMTWLSPLETTTARFGFGALILILLLPFIKNTQKIYLKKHCLHYFLLGFIGITCFQALLFWAVHLTSAINVAVIMSLFPVFTIIVEALVSQLLPNTHMIGAIIVAVAGASLAIISGDHENTENISYGWGNIIAVFAALCFTFYTVASRRWLPREIPSLVNTTIVVTIGAIFLLILTLCIDTIPKFPMSMTPVWTLIGLVIGSTVIAYICWTQAIAKTGVLEPNLIFNFTPLITMLLSSFHGISPTKLQVTGALLVISGVTWGMLHPSRQE